MTRVTPTQIRQQLLKEKGLTSFKPDKREHRKLKPLPKPFISQKMKTPMMRYLELVHGKPIETLLLSGSLSVVAKKLDNQIDVSTISKWIKRLKLRYSSDNLPQCDGCSRHGPACDGGVCLILMEMGLYSLLELKRKEMFG